VLLGVSRYGKSQVVNANDDRGAAMRVFRQCVAALWRFGRFSPPAAS
jgi:hypothetical protein